MYIINQFLLNSILYFIDLWSNDVIRETIYKLSLI